MSCFVYILLSSSLNRFYTGTTNDLERRLSEHNDGKFPGAFTKKGRPWDLFLAIECNTSSEAYALERFIKRMRSASFIRKLKENPDLVDQIRAKVNI